MSLSVKLYDPMYAIYKAYLLSLCTDSFSNGKEIKLMKDAAHYSSLIYNLLPKLGTDQQLN